jgi:hypothetical protein
MSAQAGKSGKRLGFSFLEIDENGSGPHGHRPSARLFEAKEADARLDLCMREVGRAVEKIPAILRALRRYAMNDECQCIVVGTSVRCAYCEARELLIDLTGEDV